MLQSIRDKATGPIAWFIVALIAVPFAFWGIDSYVSAPTNPEVAEVGGTEITRVQLQRAYDQSYQRLQQLMGENFQPDAIDTTQLRRGVLENLIQETLLNQHVKAAGYRASDVQILQSLRSQAAFQVDGNFSAQRYREVLSRNGYTPASYEQQLRQALAVEQLQIGLGNSAFITAKDVDVALALQKQRRQLSYLMLPYAKYMEEAQISDEAVQARYEMDAADYRTAERVKLAYVELRLDTLAPADKPEAQVLRAIYDAEVKSRFTQPERRQARHILVRVDEDVDDAAAKAKIQALRKRIRDGGEDFADVAREASDDLGSRDKGGDLGWVGRGVMVPEFEQALYKLEAGKISEAVRTSFGWHLILVDKIQAETVQAFDDAGVQDALLELYREREKGKRYEQLAKQLDELSFDYPDSLEPVADELGVKVQTTDWFTRQGGNGLAAQEAVVSAAFSPAVLDNKENSAPLKLGKGRMVVVRVADYEAAKQRPLAEVADEISKQLKIEYAQQKSQEDALAAISKLRDGVDLATIAGQHGVPVQSAGWIGRNEQDTNAAIVGRAFRLPRPSAGNEQYDMVTLDDGQAILALQAVRDGDAASASQEERDTMRRNLMAAQAQAEFRAYLAAARDDISVEIHEDQL